MKHRVGLSWEWVHNKCSHIHIEKKTVRSQGPTLCPTEMANNRELRSQQMVTFTLIVKQKDSQAK